MSEPIKLPPLTVKMLMDVFGSHADIPPALLCTSWKDGIDIDETSMRAQMLVEAYARIAVEQGTAELRAEVERLRVDAERYRWLRQRYPALTTMQAARGVGLDLSRTFVNTAEKFDAAIDAARAALKEPK